ncbi:phage resistance protein [Actinomadura sp. 7K507]|uniref:phage resistance protein n=1 Tax=Actinomadura sp. 7K507 TaxID=2530365 RepID=UPI0010483B18|nr:phage resistance protein [Actinomadura sp. 7K507]TDC74852.1 phage resistance protein [Actinomadura sp. 7K507]
MTVRLLRDLIDIPERVLAGDFVLMLSKGVEADSTVRDYVVTDQLKACFDEALGIIQSTVEGRQSRAVYLDGSFGSGKSHFMAVLHAILREEPEALRKDGLKSVLHRHRDWLKGRKFLLVPFHMIEAVSLESAVLGGYVRHVRELHPEAPLPAVYRDEGLLADARELRAALGDEAFIAGMSTGAEEEQEWDAVGWTSAQLDAALAAQPGDDERGRLVGDLVATHFRRYADAVSGTHSFIELDRGLAEISRHAKEVLGYDAIVLLLDELVLWLSGYIGNIERVQAEAQKVSKLVESAEHDRPAPIVSFVPRQRDLRDLVGRDVAGATTASLFDTLKYWDGRFDTIKLEDRNLPAVVKARLLRPKSAEAEKDLDTAFERVTNARSDVWDALLDAQGGASDAEAFRATYPFSPAFLHAMVDISSALQRQRTALKLMQQLLVDYRDVLPVGQLMPLGAIYDVLARGADRPFTDKLRGEFEQAKNFYTGRLLPYLLDKHGLTPEQLADLPSRHAFRADDLIVKTLLLAALVPNVPALRALTAGRLAALNHGSIVTMLPGQDRVMVAKTLRDLAGEFGEFQVSSGDDPMVEVSLIRVDTAGILRSVARVDDDAAKRRLVKAMLWKEFDAQDKGEFVTTRPTVWKGTERIVELVFGNVRDRERLPDGQFEPEMPGALRVVVDYPFDEGDKGPAEDRRRLRELQDKPDPPLTLAWLPSFLSRARLVELSDLIRINYLLERADRLDELTATLTANDREHARNQLRNRQAALSEKLLTALRRAYGLASPEEADLGARSEEPVVALDSRLELRTPAGVAFGDALQRIAGQLLDHAYPKHPDFDPTGRRQVFRRSEVSTVLRTVEEAVQNRVGRLEVPRTDLPVLKRIAHPARIATVSEVFVLRDDWKMLLGRRAAQSGRPVQEVMVRDVRKWILDEQPGLPPLILDLITACYALQDNRSWFRVDRQISPQEPGEIQADMVLRRQELPGEEEFQRAGERAAAIFGVSRQPVNTARAVQAMASAVRGRAGDLLTPSENLATLLTDHRGTLGLADDAPRLVTTRAAAALLNQLAAETDPTKLLQKLASADLTADGEVYRAAMNSAPELVGTLPMIQWRILDRLPSLAAEPGPKQERAAALLERLHGTARGDEYTVPLKDPLKEIESLAVDLIIDNTDDDHHHHEERHSGGGKLVATSQLSGSGYASWTRRVNAGDINEVIEEIRMSAEANPNATFEITWRTVHE